MSFYTEYAYHLQARLAPFPHWYGFLLGVDPVFQGKGYASALIMPMLTRLDRERLPCYLETHKEKNVSIYKHYGFKLIHEETIPRTSINHWVMLRDPAS
jgi:GNAT superfamily N-acetyltransferase